VPAEDLASPLTDLFQIFCSMFLVKALADRRTSRQSSLPPSLEWIGASEAQPNHSDMQE